MGNYNRDGGRNFRDSRGGGRSGGKLTMQRATCVECGNSCEVPFKPTVGKPILCDNCFGKNKDHNRGGNNNVDLTKQIQEIQNKLDTIIEIIVSEEPIKKTKKKKETKITTKKTAKKKVVPKKVTKKTTKFLVKIILNFFGLIKETVVKLTKTVIAR